MMLKTHILAFFAGFILDLLMGDPHWMPHPVRFIGGLITKTEKLLYREKHLILRGMILAVLVIGITVLASGGILIGAYRINILFGAIVESIMTYQILAVKSLKTESMKVYEKLSAGSAADGDGCRALEEARTAVSMIVGRDTACLEEEGIIKAAVETVAENTSDGVVAPMLYLAVGGPVLGYLYKAVNTMDSMIGYKNERYYYFGRAAAKLDDIANYIPARVSAWLMILASFIGGDAFDGKKAYRIYRRDNRKHASPNSAQTESVCAGALGIRLAGNASYFGKVVEKPAIGDADRAVEKEDIRRANKLLYLTAWLCEGVCVLFMGIVICMI